MVRMEQGRVTSHQLRFILSACLFAVKIPEGIKIEMNMIERRIILEGELTNIWFVLYSS